ncbi:MAG: toll/interleukin-1 receptor domain-containing protein, partial [Chloroflexota bacterium]
LYNPDLANEEIVKIQYRIFDLRATQALQISPLFISYSHADSAFVDHIDQALTAKGVRFWRDIHDAKAGRLETQIDLAIRQNPTVLLVLSKNSLSSDWVEHEVRHARKLEKELGRDALCPIALDDSWKSSKWPGRVMEQITEYNILDFSGWEDKSTFEGKFAKLLGGLDLFYKKPEK